MQLRGNDRVRFFALAVLLACARRRDQSAETINKPFIVSGARVDPDSLNAYLAAHRGFTSKGGEMRCAYRPVGQSGTKVFVWAMCSELLAVDGRLIDGSGMSLPAAFEIEVDSGRPHIVGVEVPQDGDHYGPSIRRIFPASAWPAIFADRARGHPVAGLDAYLRRDAATRFGLPAAAASALHVHDLPFDSRNGDSITIRRQRSRK